MNTGLWAGFWTWLIGKEKEDISEEEGTEEELKKDWPQKRGFIRKPFWVR